jgi:hypothetical protein
MPIDGYRAETLTRVGIRHSGTDSHRTCGKPAGDCQSGNDLLGFRGLHGRSTPCFGRHLSSIGQPQANSDGLIDGVVGSGCQRCGL